MLFKKRFHIAQTALTTVVMTCLYEFDEIIHDETSIEVVLLRNEDYCIQLRVSLQYTPRLIDICKRLQKKVVTEVEAMTGITVENVHITIWKVTTEANKYKNA